MYLLLVDSRRLGVVVFRLRAPQRRLGAREHRQRVVQRLIVGRGGSLRPSFGTYVTARSETRKRKRSRWLLLRLARHVHGVRVLRLVAERADDVPEILALLLERQSRSRAGGALFLRQPHEEARDEQALGRGAHLEGGLLDDARGEILRPAVCGRGDGEVQVRSHRAVRVVLSCPALVRRRVRVNEGSPLQHEAASRRRQRVVHAQERLADAQRAGDVLGVLRFVQPLQDAQTHRVGHRLPAPAQVAQRDARADARGVPPRLRRRLGERVQKREIEQALKRAQGERDARRGPRITRRTIHPRGSQTEPVRARRLRLDPNKGLLVLVLEFLKHQKRTRHERLVVRVRIALQVPDPKPGVGADAKAAGRGEAERLRRARRASPREHAPGLRGVAQTKHRGDQRPHRGDGLVARPIDDDVYIRMLFVFIAAEPSRKLRGLAQLAAASGARAERARARHERLEELEPRKALDSRVRPAGRASERFRFAVER
mmetsp:Transcript_3593/g.14503  ORF Transcript_3593/g.14503 Transcript_3593/m.14503 type:complete len:487 (-) Transcript_3593:133-1593(-)